MCVMYLLFIYELSYMSGWVIKYSIGRRFNVSTSYSYFNIADFSYDIKLNSLYIMSIKSSKML